MSNDELSWDRLLRRYKTYIKLERGLSQNTLLSYGHDLAEFRSFIEGNYPVGPLAVEPTMIEDFMLHLFERNVEKSTQGRILSGVKSFYDFLLRTDILDKSPTEFIEHPKSGARLPDTLSVEEIDMILEAIDLSTPLGPRNRAIIETLYSCGLRVSELVGLRFSDLFFDEGFLRVIGKRDKQRLVPVSAECRQRIQQYLEDRWKMSIDEKSADIVFLNRRGKALSRVMVFNIIKDSAALAGIDKTVSPHTFRHSFATHLLKGGANIRQVQELLGHESITTTEIYTHLDATHLRKTLETHHPLGEKE